MRQCVFVLTALLVASGCSHIEPRAVLHPLSSITSPTFCAYRESERGEESTRSEESEPVAIGRLEVLMFAPTQEKSRVREEAWVIHYLPDPLYKDLTPYSCITYGKLPPGYKQKAPASPLIPERDYNVRIRSLKDHYGGEINFNIRLDANGQPDRLEYSDNYPWATKTLRRQ